MRLIQDTGYEMKKQPQDICKKENSEIKMYATEYK